MKAAKTTMTIKVEVLSIDSIPALLAEVGQCIRQEYPHGVLTASDGDTVEWSATQTEVEF